jgi:sigma-B regulation protein RsbU (phosphoserine phosphatase)
VKTILIIEDNLAIARGLRDNLEQEGYRVLCEKDGMKGYECAKLKQPDLVILDVMLPSMDGFQICSRLKKEGFGSPIFLLTGLTQEHSRLQGLRLGADDYIDKPFSIQELLLRVRNALNQSDTVRERTKTLEDEFLRARRIQTASLPRKQPRMAGLEVFGKTLPATEVGGDYFDYLKLDRRRLGVIVADVSGKGMPAAMYVQKMQGIVQSSRKRMTAATDILAELQEQLSESMETNSFITAVVALIDPDAGMMQISQAGHLPVLFVRRGKVRLLKPPGMWIGKSSTESFLQHLSSESIAIRKGDSFVFFSDGVVEARDRKGQEFGLRRLKALVRGSHASARHLVDRCFREVAEFSENHTQTDDITVVAFKVVKHHKKERSNR